MIDNELQVRLLHAAKDRTGWKQASSRPKLGEVCLESSVDPNNSLGLVFKIKIGDNHRKFCRYIGSSEVIPPPLTPEDDWDFTSSDVLPYFGTVVTASGTPQVLSLYKYPDDYSTVGLRGKTVARIYQLTLSATESAGETTIALGINQNSYKEIRPGNNITFTGDNSTVPLSNVLEISASMDFNSLDVGDIALAEIHKADPEDTSDADAIRVYKINEVNGKIYKSSNFVDIKVSSPLTLNTTAGIGIQDGTTSQKGAVQLLDTYTTGTGGNSENNTKATTNKAITAAISSLDSQATTLDDTTSSLDIINTVTETNGVVSSTKKTLLAGNKINLSVPTGEDTNAGKIIINHDTVSAPSTTQGTQNIPSGYTEGEKETLVITDVTTDGYGHITNYKSEASTNLIAADIKAPVTKTDDTTWNYRETGGDITIGEDTAKIPSLKGNTVVWNQTANLDNARNSGATISNKSTGGFILTASAGSEQKAAILDNCFKNTEHVYYFFYDYTSNLDFNTQELRGTSLSASETFKHVSKMGKMPSAVYNTFYWYNYTTTTETWNLTVKNFCIIDLTKLFGSDFNIEKALLGLTTEVAWDNLTADQLALAATNFEKLFPNSYYPYCEGRLVNLGGYGVKWNQLYDTTVPTAETGHKYYLSEVISSTKTSSISTTISYTSGSTNRMCIDLTMMFGSGSEPTLEEFEAMFPNDYYEYNAGTEMNIFDAIGNKKLGLESTWFNQWDEQLEGGSISTSTGENVPDSSSSRSKNYIPVIAGAQYYINAIVYKYYYDANKNYIPSLYDNTGNNDFEIPSGACYLRFRQSTANLPEHICINIHCDRDGEYEPYKKDTLDLDWIREIEYTPSGSSTPEKLFPYGLLSAGSVHDEVTETKAIKRVGAVDLGTLNWGKINNYRFFTQIADAKIGLKTKNFITSLNYERMTGGTSISDGRMGFGEENNYFYIGDSNYETLTSSQFQSAMSCVMLYYELETPVEIPLAETHRMSYLVDDHGTEQQIPINVSSVINAPFRGTFEYHSNFKDAIRDAIRDLFDKVNNQKNPVKGIDDTPQTNEKLAVYDSDHTVKSSDYSVLPSGNPFEGSTTGILLPTAAQIIDYVNEQLTSSLTYKGVVSGLAGSASGKIYFSSLYYNNEGVVTKTVSGGDLYFLGNLDNSASYMTVTSEDATHYKIASGNYYSGTMFIWNESDASNEHWDAIAGNTSVSNNDPYLWVNTPIEPSEGESPWDGKKYQIGSIEGNPLTVRVPELPDIAGKQTSGNVLVGNGTGASDTKASWRGLKLDETVNNDNNNTSIGGTNTGLLERYNNGSLESPYQWRFADTSAITLINPINSSATAGKVLVGNYNASSETHTTPPSWRNLKLDELSYDGTNLIPNLGTGLLKRTGNNSWVLTEESLVWKAEPTSSEPAINYDAVSSDATLLTNKIHNYSVGNESVTTVELGKHGTSTNEVIDGFRINVPLLSSNSATIGKVLKGTKTTGVTTLPTWDNLSLEELSEVLDSAGASGYLKRVDNGESATDRYTWEFDPYGGSGVMPYKSNSDGTGDVATSSKTTAEINLLPTAGEKVLARTALREQVGTNSYVYHKISVGALENDSNIVLVLNGNFS